MTEDLDILLTKLQAGLVPEEEIYTIVHRFGHQHFLKAKETIESLLDHTNPELRYIALNVLTFHWMCQEHRNACETFLLNDSNSDNRRMGAAGLGALLEATRDSAALQLLLRVFRDDKEEWDVRDAAYRSILYILGKPASEQPSATRRLDYTNDVNWGYISEAEKLAG